MGSVERGGLEDDILAEVGKGDRGVQRDDQSAVILMDPERRATVAGIVVPLRSLQSSDAVQSSCAREDDEMG